MLYLTFIDDDVNDNEFDDEEEDVKEKKVVKKEISQSLNNFYPAFSHNVRICIRNRMVEKKSMKNLFLGVHLNI